MEWVEVEGSTVDQAVDIALVELGIQSRDDAEVQIIQEPTAGFLGMGGKMAIVKVTRAPRSRNRRRSRGRTNDKPVRTDQNTQKPNDRQAGKTNNRSSSEPGQGSRQTGPKPKGDKKMQRDDRPEAAPIEEQAKVAAGFLSGLLEAFGLEGSVDTRIEDDVLYLDVTGEQTEALVGAKGSVMYSVLELTRTVVQRKTYGAPRMRIDINGYAERRREALKIYTGKLAAQVIEEEGEIMLEPMNAADRKVVHDAVAELDKVRSYSEGDEPRRAVVIAYEA